MDGGLRLTYHSLTKPCGFFYSTHRRDYRTVPAYLTFSSKFTFLFLLVGLAVQAELAAEGAAEGAESVTQQELFPAQVLKAAVVEVAVEVLGQILRAAEEVAAEVVSFSFGRLHKSSLLRSSLQGK